MEKADKQQDNVLLEYLFDVYFACVLPFFYCIRYECALLLNRKFGVPVFPVFLAEIDEERELTNFSFGSNFPDRPHVRGKSSQKLIFELRYSFNLFFPPYSSFTYFLYLSERQL